MGRQSHSSFNSKHETVAPSAIKVGGESHLRNAKNEKVEFEVPRALETNEIPLVVQEFKNATINAKEAGFDGVEIHAANGYLIDAFFQSCTNKRTDKYGESFENRFRFCKEIIEALLQVYPAERIGIKLSPNGTYGDMGSTDNFEMFTYIAEQIQKFALVHLQVMDGFDFGFHGLGKPVKLFDIRARYHGIIVGNVGFTRDVAEGAIRSGAADAIAFGRPFLTNPDLVERYKNNWPLNLELPINLWYYLEPKEKGYTEFENYLPDKVASKF